MSADPVDTADEARADDDERAPEPGLLARIARLVGSANDHGVPF